MHFHGFFQINRDVHYLGFLFINHLSFTFIGWEGNVPKRAIANSQGGDVRNFEFLAHVIKELALTKKRPINKLAKLINTSDLN